MTYQTTLTSQGTLSLPAAVRRKYNLRPGDILTIEDTDSIRVVKNTTLADMRKKNQSLVRNVPVYAQGDGMAAHVVEKYGKK